MDFSLEAPDRLIASLLGHGAPGRDDSMAGPVETKRSFAPLWSGGDLYRIRRDLLSRPRGRSVGLLLGRVNNALPSPNAWENEA